MTRSDPTRSIRLTSGDVVVLADAARMAFHGVDRIVPGSSRLIPGGGRLNLEEARRQVVMRALEVLGAPNPAVAEKIARLRTALHEQRIAPFPGAIEVLRKIRGAGSTRLGLVTNGASDKQRAKINQHGLETFFDCIVVEGEFGCGKPDERVFRHALQMLETAPADAWMVGDNLLHDIAPAQALGLRGIWHDFRGKGLPADAPCLPARTIRRLDELLPCKEARA